MNLPRSEPAPLVAIVDPDPSSRRLIGLLLAARGLRSVEYPAGIEALAGWHRHDPPAAVVVDLELSDMPALELLQKLRDLRPAAVPVVLMPSRDPARAAEAMKEGAYEHHSRPLEPDRLLQAVGRAVERFGLQARLRALEERLGGRGGANDLPSGPEGIVPLPELERREIRRALQATGGSVGKAAKLLGLSRATLYRRLSDAQIG